jgi:hypothetical protein
MLDTAGARSTELGTFATAIRDFLNNIPRRE